MGPGSASLECCGDIQVCCWSAARASVLLECCGDKQVCYWNAVGTCKCVILGICKCVIGVLWGHASVLGVLWGHASVLGGVQWGHASVSEECCGDMQVC